MESPKKVQQFAALVLGFGALLQPLDAATKYVAIGGTGNGSSPASPLPTIHQAFRSCGSGDTVEVAGGTYVNQLDIGSYSPSSSWTQNVTIQPAAGATVTLTQTGVAPTWFIYPQHVTLKGLNINTRVKFQAGATYAVVQDCTFNTPQGSGSALVMGASNTQIIDNLFNGSPGDSDAIEIGGSSTASHDVLVERNTIRDYLFISGATHEDGIQLYNTSNVTIRFNNISNVGNSCIIINSNGSGVHNIRMENNMFNKVNTNSATTIDLRGAFSPSTDVVFVNNTVNGSLKAASSGVGHIIRNNVLQYLSETSSAEEYNYINGWNSGTGVNPDATSHTGPMPAFVDVTNDDMHLASTNTVNLAFGDSSVAPATDYDGVTRTTPVWVGADQASATFSYEAESIAAATATDAVTVKTDAAASNSKYELVSADADGDYLEYTVPVATAGTYDVKIRMMRHWNRGIIQLSIDGVNQGASQDMYSTPADFIEIDLGSKTFSTSGNKLFRFTVVGKRAASGGREFAVDRIQLSN